MNTTGLYNTAHPLAESGKPIFIPFGEWPYDKTARQRLDREHGKAIANELNERVARGEPGIPVYQGHPDVPNLAAKYPDKGALGWVTKIALANEGGRDGLALTVEWDRDPGKGFKWFSPYWFAKEKDRDGQTYIVANIRSIGLVNTPNIPEFRLANEAAASSAADVRPTYKIPQHLIDLARRFDERVRLANEANYDESKHPRAEDGKWTSGGGGGGAGVNRKTKSERSTDSFKRRMDEEGEVTELNELEAKYIKLSGDNPFDLSPEAEKALSDFSKKKADLQKRGIIEERIRGAKPGEGFRHKSTTDEMKRRTPVNMGDGRSSWTEEERKKFSDPTSHLKFVELAKRFDDRKAMANVIDANGMGHSDENGQFDGSGSGGGGGGSATKPSVADTFKAAAKKAAKDPMAIRFNDALKTARKNKDGAGIARAHMAALKAGMVWDKSIKGYRPPVVK